MAVDRGELQYAAFVHLLDGGKRFTDGQPELPAPSRGSGDAYADARALAQRARDRRDDVNLLPVVDVEQKEILCNRITNGGARFRRPVEDDAIGRYTEP